VTSPAKTALRAYAEASKSVRCPICNSIEGCDHTVRERLLADLDAPNFRQAIVKEEMP